MHNEVCPRKWGYFYAVRNLIIVQFPEHGKHFLVKKDKEKSPAGDKAFSFVVFIPNMGSLLHNLETMVSILNRCDKMQLFCDK